MKQIGKRKVAHMVKYPNAEVISLGVGDTTEPIPSVVTKAMAEVIIYQKKEREMLVCKRLIPCLSLFISFSELSFLFKIIYIFSFIKSDNSILGN